LLGALKEGEYSRTMPTGIFFLLRLEGILKETKIRLRRTMLGRKLKISVPAVSKSVIRGKKLAKAGKYALIE